MVVLILICLYIALAVFGGAMLLRTRHRLWYLPVLLAIGVEFLWHVPPNIAYLILQARGQLPHSHVTLATIGTGLDLCYLLCWLLGFLLLAKLFRQQIPRTVYADSESLGEMPLFPGIDIDLATSRFRFMLLFCMATIILYYPIAKLLEWPTQYAATEFFVRTHYTGGRFRVLQIIMQKIIQCTTAVGCVSILLRGEKKLFHRRNLLPLTAIALTVLFGLAKGSRSSAITPLMLLLATAFCLRIRVRAALVVLVIAAVVLFALAPVMTTLRETGEFGGTTGLFTRIQRIFSEESGSTKTKTSQAGEVNLGYVTGVVYDRSNAEGFAGFKPYYGLPFIFLPRMVWPNKPLLGSNDGTQYGILYHKAGFWIHNEYSSSQWLGVGAYPYWVGGIGWLIVEAVLGGMLIGFLWFRLRFAYRPLRLAVMLVGVSVLMGLHYDIVLVSQKLILRGFVVFSIYVFAVVLIRKKRWAYTQSV